MRMRASADAVLVTGSSGFLGSIVAAELLAGARRSLVLPVRSPARIEECAWRVRVALLDRGVAQRDADERMTRVHVVPVTAERGLDELDVLAGTLRVSEIVHCAGCLDYFDAPRLREANVDFTTAVLDAASRWKVRRVIYVSTAYCAGYRAETIPERLHPHPDPSDEPTEYTRTKRTAEWLIANGDVPFVILRPSIVIGDSRTGVYRGKNYGLYQMWRAWEALLGAHYSPVWYTVAPPVRLNFVHQDAFAASFAAVHRTARPGDIVHVVSDHARCPTMRDICRLWSEVHCPTEIRCYGRVDDVPFDTLPERQRRFLQLVAKSLDIATHAWRFESAHLTALRAAGLAFHDATVETIARCQQWHVAGSARIQEHLRCHAKRYDGRPRLLELGQHADAEMARP